MMTSSLMALLVALSCLVSVAAVFVALRQKRGDAGAGNMELAKMLMEISASFSKSSADIRQELSDKLASFGQDVQGKLDKNMLDGFAHFQKVQEMLGNAEKQLSGLNSVGKSIQDLNNVLNLPHLRGKILGEGNLERLLSDFLPAGFFALQHPIEGALVDAVIKFPHLSLVLPIDSKFSLEQVSALFEAQATPEELKSARKRLSDVTRQNAKDIKNKYIKPASGTTDYALMFLPSETLYFEVIRDSELWGSLVDLKVFPVSPNTLAITVHSIGKSLHYYEMARGVQSTVAQIQQAQAHLGNFRKRFEDIGEKLSKAQDSFQKAGTHLSYYSSSIERLSGETAELPNP